MAAGNSQPTIGRALQNDAVPLEEVSRRYPGPSALVQRILGAVPNAVGLLEIWPPALVTYNLSVPALLDVPRSDVGMGLSPELRAMVAHAASRSFGCQYCSAHTAIMGTVVGGPADAMAISGRVVAVREPGDLQRTERVAIDYATAAAQVPNQITPEIKEQLERSHRADRVEAIALVVAALGYMNRSMDTLGTPIETAVYDAVEEPLRGGAWNPDKHFDAEQAQADRDAGNADVSRRSRLGLAIEVPRAIAFEKAALTNVPASLHDQKERLRAALGFVPYYVPHIGRSNARRLFTHWLLERVDTDGVDVDRATKYVMGWVHARAARNHILAAHFAFSAMRHGADLRRLESALTPAVDPGDSAQATALALAHATANISSVVPPDVITRLTKHHSPASIIELVTFISIVCGIQRFTATFPPKGYEPEIAQFVAEHGQALKLPAAPGNA